jgi:hypothetical protein
MGALRWRRLDGRYLPGPGESASGYALARDGSDSSGARPGPLLDVQAFWEDPR